MESTEQNTRVGHSSAADAATDRANIPGDLSGMGGARWTAADYGTITGSGAEKLADSAVAPLVAVARGYETLRPEGVNAFIRDKLGKTTSSIEGRQVRIAVGDQDALLMPWFTADVVVDMGRSDQPRQPSSLQYRPHPANVRTDANGKRRKYINAIAQPLITGFHPSTPERLLTKPLPNLLLTEGLLKADSALTAYLLGNGVNPESLRLDPGESVSAARKRLTAMLDAIPEDKQVAILGIVGVGTWKQNPEWNTLRLNSCNILIAFDGDVATKPQVWKQANDMFQFLKAKKANPALIDLSQVSPEGGEKVGIDDYLAGGGDWESLLRMVEFQLPPRPRAMDSEGARARMNTATCFMEERVQGDPVAGTSDRWEPKVPIIGRVSEIHDLRSVTPKEEETGVFEPVVSARDVDSMAVVEVAWNDPFDGKTKSSLIEGPAKMLAARPDAWTSHNIDAAIHSDVLALPSWPPKSDAWLEAMKAHRRDETVKNASWAHMGWVPRPDGGTPVFLVGEQVIGADGFLDDSSAMCGVGESDLSGASRFGVDLPDDEEDARAAVREVLKLYRACWKELGHTSTIIASALRPVAPIVPGVSIMFSGQSSGGKSFSSAAMMAFWQAYPRAWESKRLPGSASDTLAATELALSKTPIWVVDDNAPSYYDPRSQAEQTAKINGLIRNVHNNASKRRSNKDLGSQKMNNPRALLVLSAESAPIHDTSVMNRLVHVPVVRGFLVPEREPTDALEEANRTSTLAAKVTGFAIRMVARDIAKRGWREVSRDWRDRMAGVGEEVAEYIKLRLDSPGNDTKRQSETISSLMLGIEVLRDVAEQLSMEDEIIDEIQDMYQSVLEVAVAGFTEIRRMDAGRIFMSRLASMLASKKCHIAAAGAPGVPCVVSEENENISARLADHYNSSLGWTLSDDEKTPARPGGAEVGVLVYDKDNQPIILFNPEAAFTEVQRHFGRDGHSSNSMWELVWSTGLPYTGWRRIKYSSGNLSPKVRVSPHGITHTGVPVTVNTMLNVSDTE